MLPHQLTDLFITQTTGTVTFPKTEVQKPSVCLVLSQHQILLVAPKDKTQMFHWSFYNQTCQHCSLKGNEGVSFWSFECYLKKKKNKNHFVVEQTEVCSWLPHYKQVNRCCTCHCFAHLHTRTGSCLGANVPVDLLLSSVPSSPFVLAYINCFVFVPDNIEMLYNVNSGHSLWYTNWTIYFLKFTLQHLVKK